MRAAKLLREPPLLELRADVLVALVLPLCRCAVCVALEVHLSVLVLLVSRLGLAISATDLYC
eukprot:5476843-Pyramimonas_sp.AAC.1